MLLKKICQFSKGLPIPRDKTSLNFEIPYLHYGDIYKIYNSKLDLQNENRSIIKVESEFYNNKFQIDNNDIVMNLTSENYADLGKSIIIKNKFNQKFISGMETHLVKIISQEVIPEYLSLYFQSQKFSSIIQ